MRVEEEFEDVLMNMEMQIISVAEENDGLTDFDVEKAIEALLRKYKTLARGKEPRDFSLKPLSQQIFDRVDKICIWRTSNSTVEIPTKKKKWWQKRKKAVLDIKVLSYDEIVACLKRIRKSIRLWNKEGGRTGYLDYIQQFGG